MKNWKKIILAFALVASVGFAAPAGKDVKVGFVGPSGQGNLRTTQSDGTMIQEITSGGVVSNAALVVTGTATLAGAVTASGALGVTGALTVTGASTLNGTTVIDDSLTVTGAVVAVSTVGVTGALTASGGIINATTANVTPLDVTSTNGQAIANSRSVQYLVPSGALAITNTLANPAVKGDYLEVHNGFATNVFIGDDANIEGQGALTLGANDVVAYRAINASVWRELWRNTGN